MNFQSMQLSSWNCFRSRAFSVASSLLSATHTWQIGGATIELHLPSKEQVEKAANDLDPVCRLTITGADGTPLVYSIGAVDVRVSADSRTDLPSEVLAQSINAYDLIPHAQQEELEEIASSHALIARTAYEYWLSVMRWVCDDYRIGRPQIVSNESGWSTYLHENSRNIPVWGASTCMVVQGFHKVDENEWHTAQKHLSQGSQIPIHVAQHQDAEALFAQQDYRRCTIDLCIAVETFLRQEVWTHLPLTIADEIRDYVEQANINRHINKLFPALLSEEQRVLYETKIRTCLNALFQSRNKIMHAGARDVATSEGCATHLYTVRSLFALLP